MKCNGTIYKINNKTYCVGEKILKSKKQTRNKLKTRKFKLKSKK